MDSKIDLMKRILTGLFEEISTLEKEIKKSGNVPKEICDLCSAVNKREMVDFSSKERKGLEICQEWISKNKVVAISKTRMGRYFFKTKEKISKFKPIAIDKDEFIYVFRPALSKKMELLSKTEKFLNGFDEIYTCEHFGPKTQNLLKIEFQTEEPLNYQDIDYIPKELFSGSIIKNRLVLCCDDCKQIIENSMCDGIKKNGFVFDYACDLLDIILRKRLDENKIIYENIESDSVFPKKYFYYLREESILIFIPPRFAVSKSIEKLEEVTKYLELDLITMFDRYSNLPYYLNLNSDLLFFDDNNFYLYNKNRDINKDVKKICELVEQKLNGLIEEQRGKEHDRIILAFYLIGQELGYICQREYKKFGVIIDCVWLDKKGKVCVAVEVETSSTWKKDLISTWEVEPDLAIIVGYTKTDKVATNLIESTLMKNIPHPLLYINKFTNHAFLFDKQEIVRKFNLTVETEDLNESNMV